MLARRYAGISIDFNRDDESREWPEPRRLTIRINCGARVAKTAHFELNDSYRIATAPELNSRRSTKFKSTCFDRPANEVGP
jgi:hypothetical protein